MIIDDLIDRAIIWFDYFFLRYRLIFILIDWYMVWFIGYVLFDWLIDMLNYCWVDWLISLLITKVTDWQIDWFINWLICWPIDWLINIFRYCLIGFRSDLGSRKEYLDER